MFLAAIGGLELKNWIMAPEFFWRAGRVLRQARTAPGCHHASVFQRDGVLLSLSVWENAQAMRRYATSGPNRAVVAAAPRLAVTHHFHHFPCEDVPTRENAYARWQLERFATYA
ncbi:antibiotic biosynthesis monooxygenase [Ruegeria jejuensis]|uniref:antibiotic biosynthesis monooxygenase n=1 Tax=Ruegeria jejuensis TaxID=3233338 RepID=UPI00355B9C0A